MRTTILTCLGIAATVSVSAFLLSPAAKANVFNKTCKAGTYGDVMGCCTSLISGGNALGYSERTGGLCERIVVCVDKAGESCHIKKKIPPPPVIFKEIVDDSPPPGGGGSHGDTHNGPPPSPPSNPGNNNPGGGGNIQGGKP